MTDETPKNSVVARMQEVAAAALAKSKDKGPDEKTAAPMPATKAQVIQLPLWAEPVRAVPNCFLRSALFGVVAKGRRRYVSNVPVLSDEVREMLDHEIMPAVQGLKIEYTGPRLDQADLDVWLSILHAVRAQDLGSECRVSSYMLLKLMGKTNCGKNGNTLSRRIVRLRGATLRIKMDGVGEYIGGLISSASKDEETQTWVIELDRKIHQLFLRDQYTLLGYETRMALAGQPLAQWLHGFYSSHAKPFPLKIETLQQLSGSDAREKRTFVQKLRKAVSAVSAACTGHGETFECEINDGLVRVVNKTTTGSQGRHLIRKAIAKKQKQEKPR